MSKLLKNPLFLIIGSIALAIIEGVIQTNAYKNSATPSPAVKSISLLLGVIAIVGLVVGVTLGVKRWRKRDRK